MNKLRTAHVFCLSTSIELLAEVLTDTLSHQVPWRWCCPSSSSPGTATTVAITSTAGLMMTTFGTGKAHRPCR